MLQNAAWFGVSITFELNERPETERAAALQQKSIVAQQALGFIQPNLCGGERTVLRLLNGVQFAMREPNQIT